MPALAEFPAEIWKDVSGYEGMYQVSTFGRIRTVSHSVTSRSRNGTPYLLNVPARIKKATRGSDGYYDISLYKNNQPKYFSVHQLVAQTFLPNPDNKPTVNHIDGDKSNNHLDNLEWATYDEQMAHASKLGLLNYHSRDSEKYNSIAVANLERWNSTHRVKVKCIESGQVFASLAEAGRCLGVSKDVVDNACKNGSLIGGRHFVRVDKEDIL